MCYAPLFAKISNENGIAKALANSKPICGVGYMPRRWRNFAKQTAPPFLDRTAGGAVSKGAAFGVFSFAISLRRGKEMASSANHERARSAV